MRSHRARTGARWIPFVAAGGALLLGSAIAVAGPAAVRARMSLPYVTLSPSGGSVFTASPTVRVEFCDDQSLNISSYYVKVNGVEVFPGRLPTPTASGGCGAYTQISFTASFNPGSNQVQAYICDMQGNCRTTTGNYTYTTDTAPPAVTVQRTRNSTGYDNFTITWCDYESALNRSSRRVTLNGVAIDTAQVTYVAGQKAPCASYATSVSPQPAYQNGTNTLRATIRDAAGNEGVGTLTFTAGPTITAVNTPRRDRSLCYAACFDAELGFSTPAYTSLDQQRSVSLLYSTAQAAPRGLVQIDFQDGATDAAPTLSLSLRNAGGALEALTTGGTTVYYRHVAGPNRLSAQFDARHLATGAYRYDALVGRHWPDRTEQTVVPVTVLVVNEISSTFGPGWSMPGLQRAHRVTGGVVVTEGDGSIGFYVGPNASSTANVEMFTSPAGDYSQLKYVKDQAYYQRTYRDNSIAVLTSNGYLSHVQDRFGSISYFRYDWSSRMLLQEIQDPAGKITRLAYTPGGMLSSITDPGGRVTQVVPTSGTYPNIATLEFRLPGGTVGLRANFDAQHRLSSWYEPDRVTNGGWFPSYDAWGKLAAIYNPAVAAEGGNTFQTHTRYVSMEAAQLPASGTGTAANPAPRVDTRTAWARVVATTGDTTSALIDRWGTASTVRASTGQTAGTTLDDNGLVTRTTDEAGWVTNHTWVDGRLTQTSGTGQPTVNYEYVAGTSQVSRVYGDALPEVRYFYSPGAAWTLDSTGVAGSGTTRFTYDARGRVLSVKDARGDLTTYTYEPSGWQNMATRTEPGNKVTRVGGWDAYGRATQVAAPGRGSIRSTFDVLNRQDSLVAPGLAATTFGWRAKSLIRVTNPAAQQYLFDRDGADWLVREKRPDDATRFNTFDHDRHGRLIKLVNRRGQTITRAYDRYGRDSLVTTPEGQRVHTYSAAPGTGSRWEAIVTPDAIDTLHYDATGRIRDQVQLRRIGGVWKRYVVTTGYDAAGRVESTFITHPNQSSRSIRQGFDASTGRPVRLVVSDPYERITTLGYDSAGVPTTITLPGGQVIRRSVLSNGRLGSVSYLNNAALQTAAGITFQYDSADRVVGRHDNWGHRTYGYDAAGRLGNSYTYTASTGTTCGYDDNFGFVCQPVAGQTTSEAWGFSYDAAGNPQGAHVTMLAGNRMTRMGIYELEYDYDGNITRKRNTVDGTDYLFVYNALGQMISAWRNGAEVASYRYDGLGRRVLRTAGGVSTHYLYDGDNLLEELDATGAPEVEYAYYGLDQPHSMRRGGKTYYYATDHQNSVVALFDSTGAVAGRYAYAPFGGTKYANASVNNTLRYTAREFEPVTELYYYRARWYDPELHRFTTQDPVGISGGLNLYAYVGNDPVNRTDPSGLEPECTFYGRQYRYINSRTGEPLSAWFTFGYWICEPREGGFFERTYRYPSRSVPEQPRRSDYIRRQCRPTNTTEARGMQVASCERAELRKNGYYNALAAYWEYMSQHQCNATTWGETFRDEMGGDDFVAGMTGGAVLGGLTGAYGGGLVGGILGAGGGAVGGLVETPIEATVKATFFRPQTLCSPYGN